MNNFEERLQERLKELKQSRTSVSSEELVGFEAGARWVIDEMEKDCVHPFDSIIGDDCNPQCLACGKMLG